MLLRILYLCVVRSRCPCCGEGAVFAGWLRFRDACPRCGLVYDQWVGEWITPTYLASSLGLVVGFGLLAVWMATGSGWKAPPWPELLVGGASVGTALLALRPSKTAWLGVLYWMGGVEVSARTRAQLRWEGPPERASAADARARSVHEPAPSPSLRGRSLRDVLFPRLGRPRGPRPRRGGRAVPPRRSRPTGR